MITTHAQNQCVSLEELSLTRVQGTLKVGHHGGCQSCYPAQTG